MPQSPRIQPYFDEPSFTVSYLISDPSTRAAAIIDPVLDYDHRSGTVSTDTARRVLADIKEQGLQLQWVLETHAHADHLTAGRFFKQHTGARIAIGEHITEVQRNFKRTFNLDDVSETGAEFDKLVRDGECFALGSLNVQVMHTPGHTSDCVSYRVGDAVFVGDTMFMPDYGTARADFPGADARTLYRSIRRLLSLPPDTRLFMCHDYKAPGRDYYAWETTVREQRERNVHIRDGVSEDEFVALRDERDRGLPAPQLMLPAVQVNIRAGALPQPEENGVAYLKIPLTIGR